MSDAVQSATCVTNDLYWDIMNALQGVNLGGWLIAERWMHPALFEGTDAQDEYTLSQTEAGKARIRQHHREFITEKDWQWLAQHRVEAVRIPVGYWIFDGDAPYVASIDRLDWAFAMAKKYKIQILVDLHGAPGSQNGNDHSGQRGKARWYRQREYRAQTVDVLVRLAERYRDHPQFWGLELLNEPKAGVFQFILRRFCNQAYCRLHSIVRPETRLIFHDAFTPRLMNGAIWATDPRQVTMDIHWYHTLFLLRKLTSIEWFERSMLPWRARLIGVLQRWQGVVIGEWSGVIASEALGRYDQARWRELEDEHLRQQLVAYRWADAWFYWSYKTDGPGIWNFRSLVDDGRLSLD